MSSVLFAGGLGRQIGCGGYSVSFGVDAVCGTASAHQRSVSDPVIGIVSTTTPSRDHIGDGTVTSIADTVVIAVVIVEESGLTSSVVKVRFDGGVLTLVTRAVKRSQHHRGQDADDHEEFDEGEAFVQFLFQHIIYYF
ncbi:MAG: hypothetical protein BWY68_00943 [bacterium ADurb.Bin400]|nr:MAG: hypothetical protein BWY68_00943 [bacterium ADurb.Bin400]